MSRRVCLSTRMEKRPAKAQASTGGLANGMLSASIVPSVSLLARIFPRFARSMVVVAVAVAVASEAAAHKLFTAIFPQRARYLRLELVRWPSVA